MTDHTLQCIELLKIAEFISLPILSFSSTLKGITGSYGIKASDSNDHNDFVTVFDHRSSAKQARKTY